MPVVDSIETEHKERKHRRFLVARKLGKKTPLGIVYEDVSLKVDKGQLCCVFGDQGSGKTSLLLSICGRMKVDRGACTVGGYDLASQFRRIRRLSAISFIPGINDVQPFLRVKNLTASELALGGASGNKANTLSFLQEWGFDDKKDVKFNELDSYDTARFGIVLAMAASPELLIVDDVQTGLTQHQSVKLVEFLRSIAQSRGIAVVFGCSEYEIARHADGIVVMSEGAAAQRLAVLRDANVSPADETPLVGSGNGVVLDKNGEGPSALSAGHAGELPGGQDAADADAGAGAGEQGGEVLPIGIADAAADADADVVVASDGESAPNAAEPAQDTPEPADEREETAAQPEHSATQTEQLTYGEDLPEAEAEPTHRSAERTIELGAAAGIGGAATKAADTIRFGAATAARDAARSDAVAAAAEGNTAKLDAILPSIDDELEDSSEAVPDFTSSGDAADRKNLTIGDMLGTGGHDHVVPIDSFPADVKAAIASVHHEDEGDAAPQDEGDAAPQDEGDAAPQDEAEPAPQEPEAAAPNADEERGGAS